MKTFRFFAALMLAVVCVGLSSCSKDDEDDNIDNSLLVGTWISDNGVYEYTFNADGSGSEYNDEFNVTTKFTYTFNTKTKMLIIKFEKPNADGDSQISIVIEISGDKFESGDAVFTRKK